MLSYLASDTCHARQKEFLLLGSCYCLIYSSRVSSTYHRHSPVYKISQNFYFVGHPSRVFLLALLDRYVSSAIQMSKNVDVNETVYRYDDCCALFKHFLKSLFTVIQTPLYRLRTFLPMRLRHQLVIPRIIRKNKSAIAITTSATTTTTIVWVPARVTPAALTSVDCGCTWRFRCIGTTTTRRVRAFHRIFGWQQVFSCDRHRFVIVALNEREAAAGASLHCDSRRCIGYEREGKGLHWLHSFDSFQCWALLCSQRTHFVCWLPM